MNTIWCPGCTLCRFFVDDNSCPWWYKWCSVEVELTFEKTVPGEFRIDTGWSNKIQGDSGLLQENIPLISGEIRVCATDTRNKIIFKGADTSFYNVLSVIVRWNELEVHRLLLHALLECSRCLVVKQLQLQRESPGTEVGVDGVVSCNDGGAFSTAQGSDMEGVAVVIV